MGKTTPGNMIQYLYTTKQNALAAGLTHHGKIYGVPAWVIETPDGVAGAPKVPVLGLYCAFVDWCYDVATSFMRADQSIESPLSVGKPIV